MTHYSYKRVRDQLMQAGLLDESGNPADTKTYGDTLKTDYNGNLWDIAADYIESLQATKGSTLSPVGMIEAPHPEEGTEIKSQPLKLGNDKPGFYVNSSDALYTSIFLKSGAEAIRICAEGDKAQEELANYLDAYATRVGSCLNDEFTGRVQKK